MQSRSPILPRDGVTAQREGPETLSIAADYSAKTSRFARDEMIAAP